VNRDLLLGLDIGTTSCKAALVSTAGREVGHGRAATPWRRVPTGAELDPDELLAGALAAAAQAIAVGPPGRVAALGASSFAETAVLLDRGATPVAPCIAWHDRRGGAEARGLAAEIGGDRFSEHTGLSPGPLCSAVKYRWLRRHHAAAARGVHWLSVAEWLVHALGGDQVAELSLASRTGWLDLHTRAWWDEMLAWSQAPPGLLPEPLPAGTPAGTVGDRFAAARGAVLAVGGHDHLSAAVGAGVTDEGDVLDSWGTAEAFIRAVAPVDRERVRRAVADGMNIGWHVVDGRQSLIGGMRSGAALQAVLERIGVTAGERAPLDAAALRAPVDLGCVRIAGLQTNREVRVELAQDAAPEVVWRAALELLALASERILERMDRLVGPRKRLVLVGGWADGETAQAVKEAHLGCVAQTDAAYIGARGAALTAGRAAGIIEPLPATGR